MGRLSKPSLLAFRERRQLSQAQAAQLVGITQSHWSRLEDGTAFASPALAKMIARLTGVSLETLLGIADTESGANAGERSKTA